MSVVIFAYLCKFLINYAIIISMEFCYFDNLKMSYLHENFLLPNKTAQRLFHGI